MKRITGISDIFFKTKDLVALRQWYRIHLGIDILEWAGTVFSWKRPKEMHANGYTVWAIFPIDTDFFRPAIRRL